MNHFTIVSNRIKDSELNIAVDVKNKILAKCSEAVVNIAEMEECKDLNYDNVDCVIVLGGDGTLLRVAKDTMHSDVPLIGVNLGTLGYLAEVELAAIDEAIDSMLNDEYHIENRMMLEGSVISDNAGKVNALNDVVLSRRLDLQLVGYRVYVNNVFLSDFFADGIILSSPTGSTGYNMSAGGSIVEPNAELIVLTPVCPHTLNTRSIILSSSDEILVEILPPKGERPVEVGVYFDGGNTKILSPGDKVLIKKSDISTRICKLSDEGFLEILQKKMNE